MHNINLKGIFWEDEEKIPNPNAKLSTIDYDAKLKIYDEANMYNNLAIRIGSLDYLISVVDTLKEVQTAREYLAFIKSREHLSDRVKLANDAVALAELKLSSELKEFSSASIEGLKYLIDAYKGTVNEV